MSEFFKYTGESIIKAPNVLLSRRQLVNIQEFCTSALGFKNINSVRDRFDGQRFMDNQIRKVGSLFAIADHFNLEKPILGDTLISNPNPLIKINGKEYQILSSDFGELPNASNLLPNYDVIVTCRRDDVYFVIIGFLDKVLIADKKLFKENAIGKSFIGFKSLKPIS